MHNVIWLLTFLVVLEIFWRLICDSALVRISERFILEGFTFERIYITAFEVILERLKFKVLIFGGLYSRGLHPGRLYSDYYGMGV